MIDKPLNERELPDQYRDLDTHLLNALTYYVEDGTLPGSFLKSIICNDLYDAISYADNTRLKNLKLWVSLVLYHTPKECHGSENKFEAWKQKKSEERGK